MIITGKNQFGVTLKRKQWAQQAHWITIKPDAGSYYIVNNFILFNIKKSPLDWNINVLILCFKRMILNNSLNLYVIDFSIIKNQNIWM